MSDIKFTCPGCGGNNTIDATAAGTAVKCPHCGAAILVPASGSSNLLSISAKSRRLVCWLGGGLGLFVAIAALCVWWLHKPQERAAEKVILVVPGDAPGTNQSAEAAPPAPVRPQTELPVGEISRFEGHTDPVGCVAVSPDGRYALTGCGPSAGFLTAPERDYSIRVWDLTTGQAVNRFLIHTDMVTSIVFTRNGKLVVSGSDDGTVCAWNLLTGQQVSRFKGTGGSLCSMALVPNENQIVAGYATGAVQVLSLENGREIRRFQGHEKQVLALAISRDGRWLVSGSADKTARVWDLTNGGEKRRFDNHTEEVFGVAISPDGRRIASASGDATVRLWNRENADEIRQFKGHEEPVVSVAFSPDGTRIISCSGSESLETGGAFGTMSTRVGTVKYTRTDGQLSETKGGKDSSVRLWDVESGDEIYRFIGHTKRVNQVVFSPDGRSVVSASSDRTVRLWGLPKPGFSAD